MCVCVVLQPFVGCSVLTKPSTADNLVLGLQISGTSSCLASLSFWTLVLSLSSKSEF